MAVASLPAASNAITDPQLKTGVALPATEATSVAGDTGFTVAWADGLVLRIVVGTAATTATFVAQSGSNPSVSLSASTTYLFGPISSNFSNGSGVVTVNLSGALTGASAGAYLLAKKTGTQHNPFETNPSATDY